MLDYESQSQTILMLGASGKIGLEIRRTFHAIAPNCNLLCCSRAPWLGEKLPNETWLQFDPLADKWEFDYVIDVVINAVGAISETKSMTFQMVHVGITKAILANRKLLENPRIVQVSALGADPLQASIFLKTKGEADLLLLGQDDTVVIRPSIVCTPDTMLSKKMRTLLSVARFGFGKLLVPMGFPATQIQPILGTDVSLAIVNAALNRAIDGVVELVGPEKIAFGELIETMASAQARKVRLVEVSREIMETFVQHFVGVWFPGLINIEQFRLLFQHNVGDLKQTQNILGRMPKSTLEFWRGEADRKFKEVENPLGGLTKMLMVT